MSKSKKNGGAATRTLPRDGRAEEFHGGSAGEQFPKAWNLDQ